MGIFGKSTPESEGVAVLKEMCYILQHQREQIEDLSSRLSELVNSKP